jgi:glycerophosphoryl diester phosphodiesterase
MNTNPSFQVIAHRGDSVHAVGNTAEAFQRAIDTGVPLVETDVRLTADGILIIEHDEDIGGLLIADATLAELRAVNPALLTVAATLKLFGQTTPFCWEVKAPQIVPALVTLVRDLTPAKVWAHTEFTSFVWANVLALRAFSPESSVGWLTSDWNEAVIVRVVRAGLRQICPPAAQALARPDLIKVAHAKGLKVRVWSVSEVALVTRLAAIGVDGGTVNFPGEALEALAGQSSH